MCTGAFLAKNSHHSNTYIVDSNSPILCAGNFRPPVAVRGHAPTCSRAQEAAGRACRILAGVRGSTLVAAVRGPGQAATLSGWAGLPDKRPCKGGQEAGRA